MDLSDEGLVRRFGDLMHEMPELYEAIRLFEMKNRPTKVPGGFNVKSDAISVQREGGMLRLQCGNSGR
ncbi:hypothetical protein GOL86_21090 [Sinorhizobium medicae]|nr:hypothetical protein [Sinorhizobium medicae]